MFWTGQPFLSMSSLFRIQIQQHGTQYTNTSNRPLFTCLPNNSFDSGPPAFAKYERNTKEIPDKFFLYAERIIRLIANILVKKKLHTIGTTRRFFFLAHANFYHDFFAEFFLRNWFFFEYGQENS